MWITGSAGLQNLKASKGKQESALVPKSLLCGVFLVVVSQSPSVQ